ncbi:unnamed protein product [marine sediment metagenome]|uniref:Uncharacterized protein n=1 Tax=marine sediment metagenome TaxID=412755 RepID=X0UIC9_9ZZZZ
MKTKYKIGDRVRIKTWKEMEKEFGLWPSALHSPDEIKTGHYLFTSKLESILTTITDRILTIESGHMDYYYVKELGDIDNSSVRWKITDEMIAEKEALDPIKNRFEILDL